MCFREKVKLIGKELISLHFLLIDSSKFTKIDYPINVKLEEESRQQRSCYAAILLFISEITGMVYLKFGSQV